MVFDNGLKFKGIIRSLVGISMFASGILLLLQGASFAAETGISANEILVGQSCALSGPAAGLGRSYQAGASAYFSYLNEKGGIKGRKIRLISLDDGYEPERCEANTEALIETEKVFLLFGYVGTPTSKAVLPLVTKHKIPFFAPMTGAGVLRDSKNPYVFNLRADYNQETRALIDSLLNERKFRKIAVFYQDDAFGKSGLAGVEAALAAHGEQILTTASYARNTIEVEGAVAEIMSKNPDAVIMVGTYEPCAEFIRQMRAAKSNALYLTISFVGSEILARKLREKGEGIGTIISQVVPSVNYLRIPIVREFNQIFERYNTGMELDEIQMEGYIAAKTMCSIISSMNGHISRENFLAMARAVDLDYGGFTVNFNNDRQQGSDAVFFTQIGPGGYLTRLENFLMMYEYDYTSSF